MGGSKLVKEGEEKKKMMLGMEDVIMSEIAVMENINEQGLPPGFRFHPTDEELIAFYLTPKVFRGSSFFTTTGLIHIAEVDLNRCEPWELPGTYVELILRTN